MGYYKRVLRVLLLIGATWLLLPPATSSASGTWSAGDFSWGDSATLYNMPLGDENCHASHETVIGITSLPESGQICVYDRPNFRYGVYRKEIPVWYGATFIQKYFVVSLGNDSKMYVVENMNADRLPIYVAGSNDVHLTRYISYGNNQVLTYIKDFPTKLQRTTEFGQTLRYTLAYNAEQPFIPSMLPDPVVIGAASASANGRWMAVEIKNVGFVRIDTKTRSLYGFSNYVHPYNRGMDASIVFKISDDGTKIAAFDSNISPIVHSLGSACNFTTDTYDEGFINSLRTNECPNDGGRLYDALLQIYQPNRLRNAEAYGFNNDADTLYFDDVIDADTTSATVERKPLYAGQFRQERSIEYLALGDSFTSGEGDIEKNVDGSSYYLSGTKANNECHVSSRSYPFLLAKELNVTNGRMQTVACSGAHVLPDYIGNPDSYKGQGDRVSNLSATALAARQKDALNNFAPGIVTQLEFIKKYQPKTITLMGGGNDVGFSEVLEYCASPTWQGAFVDDTCGFAIEGDVLRNMLGQSIQSQYTYTLKLLRMIKQASPNTSVYVIGYPSFISEDEAAVCLNSAALNADERVMINQGVTTMNAMLQTAASSMGVQYIDIQDVLTGGRLCEGSEYVTGLIDIGIDKVVNNNTRESFHPNALAHARMASRILANNFQIGSGQNGSALAEPATFDALTQFGASQAHATVQRPGMLMQIVEQSMPILHVPAGSLAPGSSAVVTMFSQPTQLGEVEAGSDGSTNESIILPTGIKPGRHILVVDGKTPSGEPIYYYQFVTVLSQVVNDADGDGIADEADMCAFIVSWIDEVTRDDVCSNQLTSNAVDGQQSGHAVATSVGPSVAYVNDAGGVTEAAGMSDESINANTESGGEVKGAHTTNDSLNEQATTNYTVIILISIIGLSTLLGGYGILKAIRSR